MLKKIALPLVLVSFVTQALAVNPALLTNNKEARSLKLTKKLKRNALKWAERFEQQELAKVTRQILNSSILEFNNRAGSCDLGIFNLILEKAKDKGLLESSEEFMQLISFMRDQNQIDDIFFGILQRSHELSSKLTEDRSFRTNPSKTDLSEVAASGVDLKKAYEEFVAYPNEIDKCSLGRFGQLMTNIGGTRGKYFYNKMERYNRVALANNLISQATFKKLQVLTEEKVLDWEHYVRGYFEVVENAKDKLLTASDTGSEQSEPEEYVSRKHKLTQRGRLYKNFDSTQIMMLAGVVERAARRMDASRVTINFEFDQQKPEDVEVYVLSPMERYRLAINMLKKDMGELMRKEIFAGMTIEYEDVVTAAYETGLIKSEELDYILKFEEFWNPTVPRWKKYAGFTFSLLGTASFYLPPPWNIIGAIGLVVTQTKVMSVGEKPSSDDSWNSVI